jgi:hypothetical protein
MYLSETIQYITRTTCLGRHQAVNNIIEGKLRKRPLLFTIIQPEIIIIAGKKNKGQIK